MASVYSKAPTFVDNSKSTLAVIDSYDKEMQRINQDYANAGKFVKDFKSKIDIIKDVDKTYFDEKYNSAVGQFSSGLDLTKRGQVGQVEGLLNSIVQDETIINAINSTKKVKKVLELRNELKTNPKYKNAHRAADEFAEQQAINSYLQSGVAGENFALSGNIITMDTDKLVADISKNVQYEEASTNFGPVNTYEKFKSPERTITAVYQGLINSPQALEAEKNNFNYQYQTPEAQANYLNGVKANKKDISNKVNSRILEVTAALQATNNPLQKTALRREFSNLSQEKEILKNLDTAGPFQAYILNKAYTTGKSLQETKAIKMEVDQYTKYFTDKEYKERDFANKDRDFAYKQQQDAINNNLKERKLAIEAVGNGTDENGNPVGDSNDFYTAESTVSFQELEDPAKELKSQKSSLILGNSADLRDVTQMILDIPNTPLNAEYKKLRAKNLIGDHSKGQLASDAEFKTILNLKQQFILNAGTPLTKEQRIISDKLDAISQRNEEYRELERIDKIAKDRASLKGSPVSGFQTISIGSFTPFSGVENEFSKAYKSELAAGIQSKNAPKEIIIADRNASQDRKGNYNIGLRTYLESQIKTNGLRSLKGEKFGIEGITSGENGGVFGKNTISTTQFATVDWDNAVFSLIPSKDGHMVKLKLNPVAKDKSVNLPDSFKNGYALVPVSAEVANKLAASKGQSLGSFLDTIDKYTVWNNMGYTKKEKDFLLGNDLLSIKSINLGNTKGNYKIEARDGGNYFINMNIAGTPITTYTKRPQELFKKLEEDSARILDLMKNQGTYTPAAYNKEIIKHANRLKETNQY